MLYIAFTLIKILCELPCVDSLNVKLVPSSSGANGSNSHSVFCDCSFTVRLISFMNQYDKEFCLLIVIP